MSSYTTTTNKLKITELDFDSIKSALTTYLRGQNEFMDYDFTGSAMNILLDVLAYNTHYNGFYVNMLASEMFMDSATLRSSIVSLAKHLGYTPSSKKGAFVNVDIVFTGATTNISLLKGAKFTTRMGTFIYTFLATESRVSKLDETDGLYKIANLKIREGVSFSSTQAVLGSTNEIFTIPNENVDIDTLVVAAGGQTFIKADDITEITSTDKVYFVQEGNQNKYEVYFGDGVIGKKPDVSDLIQMEYNVSMLGEEGNGAKTFTFAETLSGGASAATVSLTLGHTRSTGGSEREAVSTIRIQAPRQYALQKRVVTANDYRTRLENDYDVVDSVRVWGGEENDPPSYGDVFVSIKPKTGYVLSNAEQDRIGKEILKKRNMVTITPKFVDPNYLFVIVDASVAYDPRKTTRTFDQIKELVTTTILNYSSTSLDKFDEYFRHSVLSRAIDDTEISITNNNTTIAIKRRIKPVLRVESTHRVLFGNPIYRPHSGHRNVIQSSLFSYRGIPNCMIIDIDGRLQVVRTGGGGSFNTLNSSEVLTKTHGALENANIGWIDYNSGEMSVGPFKPTTIADGSDYVYFAAKPRINDILPKQNTIITVESSDITVNMIDDTDRITENKVRGY